MLTEYLTPPTTEVNDILFIVDVLITDYSSIIYEMSLLKKPMLFFAFDQKYYEATRDFYEPYEELVPGKIVHDFDELMTALRDKDYEFEKMEGFIKKNFKYRRKVHRQSNRPAYHGH